MRLVAVAPGGYRWRVRLVVDTNPKRPYDGWLGPFRHVEYIRHFGGLARRVLVRSLLWKPWRIEATPLAGGESVRWEEFGLRRAIALRRHVIRQIERGIAPRYAEHGFQGTGRSGERGRRTTR